MLVLATLVQSCVAEVHRDEPLPSTATKAAIAAIKNMSSEVQHVVERLDAQQTEISRLTKTISDLRSSRAASEPSGALRGAPTAAVAKHASMPQWAMPVASPSASIDRAAEQQQPAIAQQVVTVQPQLHDASSSSDPSDATVSSLEAAEELLRKDVDAPENTTASSSAAASPGVPGAAAPQIGVAARAERVLIDSRPRMPWWAVREHDKGPEWMQKNAWFERETDKDFPLNRYRAYPVGYNFPDYDAMRRMLPPEQAAQGQAMAVGQQALALPPANAYPPQDVPQAPPPLPPQQQPAPPPTSQQQAAPPPPQQAEPPMQAPPPLAPAPAQPQTAAQPPPPQPPQAEQKAAPPPPPAMGFFGPPPSGQAPRAPA